MPGLLDRVRALLQEPRVRDHDPSTVDFLEMHRAILRDKAMIRDVFADFYQACLDADARHFTGTGPRVELGAGVGLFKEMHPELVSTDIKVAHHLDLVVDAQRMPFPDGSVHAFYGIDCFHHFSDPAAFFAELTRVLRPGGGCVLIDPYHGAVASLLYPRLFASEGFDKTQTDWRATDAHIMTGANQALSYIVFERDRARFAAEFPALELVEQRPLPSYLRYLGSGGLNFRQLVPTALLPLLRWQERVMTPAHRHLALHHLIVLRRRMA